MRLLDDDPDLPPQINIVPMLDALFAILAFFILSTLFLTRSQGLPVNLPQAASSQPQESTEATVTLDIEAQLFLNQSPIQLEQLEPEIRSLQQDSGNLLVIIQADEQVDHGAVVAVMDEVRQVPGVRLAIATTQQPN